MPNAERLKKGEAEDLYAQASSLVEHVGLSVTKACARVGIHPRTYYWHHKKKTVPTGIGTASDPLEAGQQSQLHDTQTSAMQSESAA